jgi:hypothetical protein
VARVVMVASLFVLALAAQPVGLEGHDDDVRAAGVALPPAADDAGAEDPGADDAVAALDELAALAAGDAEDEADDAPLAHSGRWTDADVRAALAGRATMVRRIIYCEVGRSGVYDPYAVGRAGEVGPAQLLPGRGNGLSIFYSWGFDEPNNPWQAVAFVERVIERGMLHSQYPRTSLGCPGSP